MSQDQKCTPKPCVGVFCNLGAVLRQFPIEFYIRTKSYRAVKCRSQALASVTPRLFRALRLGVGRK